MEPLSLPDAARLASRIRTEIQKAVVGQESVVDELLVTVVAAGHALIEGVPGLGKTLLARALAQSFSGTTRRVQFTPDLMPADVVGHVFYDATTGEMKLRRGPVFAHLLLADEVNRAPAKTQAALLEVMQERQVTIEGESLEMPSPFVTLATMNPIEMEGTYPLPEAQLDRFLLKIRIDYPAEHEEVDLTRHVTEGRVGDAFPIESVEAVATPEDVLRVQAAAAAVRVDPSVLGYAVRLVRATRDWAGVSIGAGPRAAIALVRAARAVAMLGERDFVVPDDVKQVATAVLRHRLRLTADAELEGVTTDDVVASVQAEIPAPRE